MSNERSSKLNTGLPLKGTRQSTPLREAQACPGEKYPSELHFIDQAKTSADTIPACASTISTKLYATDRCLPVLQEKKHEHGKIGIGTLHVNLPSPWRSELHKQMSSRFAKSALVCFNKNITSRAVTRSQLREICLLVQFYFKFVYYFSR